MTTMIERVAEAIFTAMVIDLAEGRSAVTTFYIDNARSAARAAIETMREPTEAMVAKGSWASLGRGEVGSTGAVNAYRAMIEAALNEKEAT